MAIVRTANEKFRDRHPHNLPGIPAGHNFQRQFHIYASDFVGVIEKTIGLEMIAVRRFHLYEHIRAHHALVANLTVASCIALFRRSSVIQLKPMGNTSPRAF
jgi:hypothetical protein